MATQVITSVHEKARALCHQPRAWTTSLEDADMPKLPASYYPDTPSAPCAFHGCDEGGRRWYRLCARHARQYRDRGRDYGRLTPLAPRREDPRCLSCGDPVGGVTGFKKWCSAKCEMRYRRAQPGFVEPPATSRTARPPQRAVDRPTSRSCVNCGATIDLTAVGKGGRIKRLDTKLCWHCANRRSYSSPVSWTWLANRDGTDCSLCGDPIDLELRHPHLMRASVDHVVPVARGGTDDPENLKLAHLWCNQVKSDRHEGKSDRPRGRTLPGRC
jgi:hypothetical protein